VARDEREVIQVSAGETFIGMGSPRSTTIGAISAVREGSCALGVTVPMVPAPGLRAAGPHAAGVNAKGGSEPAAQDGERRRPVSSRGLSLHGIRCSADLAARRV